MNVITKTRLVLALVALAASLTPGGLFAADSDFQVTLAPLVFEGLWLDQDTTSSKFQEYRDLSDGFRLQAGLTGMTKDTKRMLDFQVVNGGRRDAFYGLSYDVAGSWGLELSYDNIPHNFGNDGKILWARTGPGSWEIQDPIQQALQGANEARVASGQNVDFAWLSGLIQPYLAVANTVDLGLERRRTRAALELGRGGNASWNLEYKHEARNGLRNLGTSFGLATPSVTRLRSAYPSGPGWLQISTT